ncbi:MAG: V-type ATPase subunit [Candidatus Heimdallarchaeota archaeon]|nr:V-type ATPase subunit [Candidatus Heimdallarchaeota archaeon]
MMTIFNSTIPFLISKAHAYHSRAPTLGMITNMVQASSVSEIENILQQTHYADVASEHRPSVNLAEFEIALRRQYAELLTTFTKAASPDVTKLLDAYSLLIESDNMRMILQAVMNNSVSDEIKQAIIPIGKYGMEYYERMMGTTTVEAALDFVRHPALNKAAREALKMSNDPDEQIFYLSSALSHASYSLIFENSPNWIKKQIEILNLETTARAVKLGINPVPWIIPNNGLIFRMAPTLGAMKSVRDVFSYVLNSFPASHLVERALQAEENEMVSVFEENAQAERFHIHRRNFNIYGNRKESILDFFVIKKAEMEDLTRILLGTIKGVSPDLIREMLSIPIYRREK